MESFFLVAKVSIVQPLIEVASVHCWSFFQINVKDAFLN